MSARLTFHGAAGCVTGFCALVETEKTRLLVDCGLFQGLKTLRLRNWTPLPVDPASIPGSRSIASKRSRRDEIAEISGLQCYLASRGSPRRTKR